MRHLVKIAFIVSPVIIMYCFFIISNIISSDDSYKYVIDDNSIEVLENIKKIIEERNSDEINLEEVFTFEWERAYITNLTNGKDKAFYKEMPSSGLPMFDEGDNIRSILFIKNGEIIHIYEYLPTMINFLPSGNFFTKENAVFEIEKRGNWFSKKIVLKLTE